MVRKARLFNSFILFGLVLIMIFSLSACGKEKHVKLEATYLDIAYANGWITQEQLKSIAYYYNEETEAPDFELIPKLPLSKETEDNIKFSYLQKDYIKKVYPDATIDHITVFRYYGTYNNYAVVFIKDDLFMYDLKIEPEKEIGGVVFYNYCALSAYKLTDY